MESLGHDVIWHDAEQGSRDVSQARSGPAAWTEERVARLHELAIEGLTASEIAAALGVTRNAVMGKMKRCQIPLANAHGHRPCKEKSEGTPKKTRGVAERSRVRRIKLPPLPMEELRADTVEPLRVGFMDLAPHHCRWILDDKDDNGLAISCGNERAGDLPYCPGHCRLAYRRAA